MKITLFGYGKMGQTIERLAAQRGQTITGIIDINTSEQEKDQAVSRCDAVIEFTQPQSAINNIRYVISHGKPIVVGTTGWLDQLPDLRSELPDSAQLFYASNFSIGVNLFFAANEYLAKLMNDYKEYDVRLNEVHHIHKLDEPSGTAITTAQGILQHLATKNKWVLGKNENESDLEIHSKREGEVFGYHEVQYRSAIDTISLSHDAHSRDGFANGAISAAEWIISQEPGIYTMKDMLNL